MTLGAILKNHHFLFKTVEAYFWGNFWILLFEHLVTLISQKVSGVAALFHNYRHPLPLGLQQEVAASSGKKCLTLNLDNEETNLDNGGVR